MCYLILSKDVTDCCTATLVLTLEQKNLFVFHDSFMTNSFLAILSENYLLKSQQFHSHLWLKVQYKITYCKCFWFLGWKKGLPLSSVTQNTSYVWFLWAHVLKWESSSKQFRLHYSAVWMALKNILWASCVLKEAYTKFYQDGNFGWELGSFTFSVLRYTKTSEHLTEKQFCGFLVTRLHW